VTRKTTTVHLSKEVASFLEERGAVADPSKGNRNRSAALRRAIERLDAALRHNDPREDGFPEAYVGVLATLLVDPWSIDANDIGLLDVIVARQPQLRRAYAAARVDPDALVAALQKLGFVERLSLVDILERQKGQPSRKGSPRRPR
jgi:hypothetical protein